MKLLVLAVGTHVPRWAADACEEYAKRFPPELRLRVHAVKTESRAGGRTAGQAMAAEARRLRAAIPAQAHVVALDETGSRCSTQELARRLHGWQQGAADVALLIGGPDGLDPELLQSAHERLRLSDLTLPHALARVLLLEQLYRAWSILAGHPYHRA